MTKKIESLTDEQRRQLETFADPWIEKALCTDPADRQGFETAIRKCYGYAKLDQPKRVVWVDSPLIAAMAGPLAAFALEKRATHGITGAIGAIGEIAGTNHLDAIREATEAACLMEIGNGKDSAADRNAAIAAVRESWWKWIGGTCWLGWSCYTAAMRDVVKVELDQELWDRDRAYAEALAAAGHAWLHREFIIVSERPSAIRLEQVGPRGWGSHRLHCEDGPALGYRDGWGVYAWHGVRVPKHVIENPDEITVAEIKKETNEEVRRVMRERYGDGRYLMDTGAKLVDTDAEGHVRKGGAPRCLLEDDEGRRWLVGTDGSTGRTYYMEVPETVKTCREAHEARCGFDETLILNKS